MGYTDQSVILTLKTLGVKTGRNLLGQLIELYLATTPEALNLMNQFLKEKNYTSLAKNAHTFKSSCGNLGINEMYRICDQIETKITTKCYSHDELSEMIFKLNDLQDKVLEELRLLQ